jgi:hypothetical protein
MLWTLFEDGFSKLVEDIKMVTKGLLAPRLIFAVALVAQDAHFQVLQWHIAPVLRRIHARIWSLNERFLKARRDAPV